MTATISATNGAGSTSPTLLATPYAPEWESRNITHDLLGGGIAVALLGSRPRAGEIVLVYADEAAAWACARLHQQITTFTLTETDNADAAMTYAVNGRVTCELDEQTGIVWLVTVGYQEI